MLAARVAPGDTKNPRGGAAGVIKWQPKLPRFTKKADA